jgi:hypothetical protein
VVELDDEVDLASVGVGSSGASLATVYFHTLLCSRAANGAGLGARRNEVQQPASAADRMSLSLPPSRRLMQANSVAAEPKSARDQGPPPAFNVSGVNGARIFVGGSSSPIAVTATVQVPGMSVVPAVDVDWPPRRAWIIYEPGARMIGLQVERSRG